MLNCADYAHYLHPVRNQITDEEGCKVVFEAGLATKNEPKLDSRILKFLTEEEIELLREACETTLEKYHNQQ